MSDNSAIEWTDATWNPVTGCTEVSPGCDHCYAKTFAERWRGTPGHYFERGFDVVLRPDKLDQPLKWKRPRRVFVNSMSDLFHEQIGDDFIAEVFSMMARTPQHTYQLLTKRHGRMRSLLSRPSFRDNLAMWGQLWPLPNVWLGVSVEDQKWADIRIPALLDTPAAVRFLSCEPLLGPVDLAQSLARWQPGDDQPWKGNRLPARDVLHWVIAGGESGHGARPMCSAWVRKLRDQCQAAGASFFFKQWGEYRPGHILEPRVVHVPAQNENVTYAMVRVGKKAAGRELDGRTWDEYPQAGAR